MITGFERLNSSATCWASLKLLGVTTCIDATPPPLPAGARRRPLRGAGSSAVSSTERIRPRRGAGSASPATGGGATDGLARRHARVESHLTPCVALVVLALLDVITLNEAEVLQRASPCVSNRHLGSDSA